MRSRRRYCVPYFCLCHYELPYEIMDIIKCMSGIISGRDECVYTTICLKAIGKRKRRYRRYMCDSVHYSFYLPIFKSNVGIGDCGDNDKQIMKNINLSKRTFIWPFEPHKFGQLYCIRRYTHTHTAETDYDY